MHTTDTTPDELTRDRRFVVEETAEAPLVPYVDDTPETGGSRRTDATPPRSRLYRSDDSPSDTPRKNPR